MPRKKPIAKPRSRRASNKNCRAGSTKGVAIRRTYRTTSWKGTLMVINTVGHLAEAAWHHPDLTASYASGRSPPPEPCRQGDHGQGFRTREKDRGSSALAARQGRRRSRGDPLRSAFCLSRLQKKLTVNFGNGRRLGAVQASWDRDNARSPPRGNESNMGANVRFIERSRRWVWLN